MSEENKEPETIDSQLVKFDSYGKQIEEIKQQHSIALSLQIKSKADYIIVDNARKAIKKLKNDVEKDRKSIKEIVIATGKKIEAAAKVYSEPLELLESELSEKQKVYDAEQERIKFLNIQMLKLPERMQKLLEITLEKPESEIIELSDIEFNKLVFERKEELQKIESARLAEIAENQRLAQLAIDTENKRIADEKQRAIELAEAEQKAAENARIKAEFEASEKIRLAELDKIKAQEEAKAAILKAQEDAEKAIKAAADKAEAERKEAENQAQAKAHFEQKAKEEKERLAKLAPDKEKFAEYLKALRSIPKPELSLPESEIKFKAFAEKMKLAIAEIS